MERIEKGSSETRWLLDQAGRGVPLVAERSDAARNRRRILETAHALFEERGVTNVTMEEIARQSDVGKGTLYRRFPHKGVLCQALLDEPTRIFQQETLEKLGEPGMDALEKLDLFFDNLARFTDENLDLLYGGQECLSGASRLERFSHPAHDWRRWTVLSLLRRAARDGMLDEELDVEYVAAALLAPLEVDFFYYQRRVQGISVERISAGLRSLAPKQ